MRALGGGSAPPKHVVIRSTSWSNWLTLVRTCCCLTSRDVTHNQTCVDVAYKHKNYALALYCVKTRFMWRVFGVTQFFKEQMAAGV